MDNLELQIKKAADTIIDRKGTATSVVNRVSTCMISKLNQKNFLKLSHEEVKEIGNDLIIGSPLSYQTWLHRNCFNDLIWELKKYNLIESPYFNIPQQIRRHLIIHYKRELWANLIYVKAIHDDLISLKTKTYFSLIEKEEDYVCSFIVSCALFGKILFPGIEAVPYIKNDPVEVKLVCLTSRLEIIIMKLSISANGCPPFTDPINLRCCWGTTPFPFKFL